MSGRRRGSPPSAWRRRDVLRTLAASVAATAAGGGVLAASRRALAQAPTLENLPPEGKPRAAPTGSPAAGGDAAADRKTEQLLRTLVERRAVQSKEPWLMAHVVLALGRDVKDGDRPIVDAMVADSLELTTIAGRTYPHFSLQIERHPFHFLQILQATDVPYDRRFTTPRGTFTRREIVQGSEAVFDPRQHVDEYSWTVCVLTHEFPPDRDRFENARGERVDVAKIVAAHLNDAETAYAATFASMNEGKPYGRGAIHNKACNGTHLIYGLIEALVNGYGRGDVTERVDRLVRATIFRLQLEQKLVDATLRGSDPMVRLNADAVKLSFLGHVLEALGLGVTRGVLKLDAAQLGALAVARRQLGHVVDRLISDHDLDALRAHVPNAYGLLLGDACHALRGLEYWT